MTVEESLVLVDKLQKRKARRAVEMALRRGALERKPCEAEDCFIEKTEAHHPDYNLPLTVVWLCKSHHSDLHTSINIQLASVGG